MAVVITDVKGKVAKKLPTEEVPEVVQKAALAAVADICAKTSRLTVGFDVNDGCSFRVRLACASFADADDVDEACQALAKVAKSALDRDTEEPKSAVEKAGKNLSTQLLRGVEFGKTVDHVVEVRMTAAAGLAELLKVFDAGDEK
jgi:hypothetical protein